MNPKKIFELAQGSTCGRDHRVSGKNNHDAVSCLINDEAIIAIVCDGCSSGKHSEVGAKLGAQLIATTLCQYIYKIGESINLLTPEQPFPYWERVRQDVLAQLRVLANAMGSSLSQTVNEYFLFTVVGLLVLPNYTSVFSIGDGVFVINGEVNTIGPFPNNAPPYLAYGLTGSSLAEEQAQLLDFQIHRAFPNQEIDSIMIGTDGVCDLANVTAKEMPGKPDLVGPLSQFWEKDLFFRNPDALRRRLSLINRDVTRLNPVGLALKKELGLLPDDTTMAVIRRCQTERS
jgi:hypothetical protein